MINRSKSFLRKSRLLILVFSFLTNSGIVLTQTAGKAPVLFIVDASGSMTEIFHGVPRMVAARVMLFEKLKNIDPEIPVGLVAYGNRIPGCQSHRIYASIRTKNRRTLVEQIKKLYPAGATPLGNTLRMAGTRLLPYYPGTRVVIISDGAESCGGDPVREIQKIRKRGYGVVVNVIGLDVDVLTAIQLKAIARAGEGRYYDVKNHTDFSNAITDSTSNPTNRIEDNKTHIENTPPIQKSLLEIRKVYRAKNAGGELVWKIKYHFQATRPGDYYVSIRALKQPATEGPGGQIVLDDRVLNSRGDSWYSVKNGRGEIEIKISKQIDTKKIPIYFQGELWDTSGIPLSIYLSNFKKAIK